MPILEFFNSLLKRKSTVQARRRKNRGQKWTKLRDSSPRWLPALIAGALIIAFHIYVIPVAPQQNLSFPTEGEIAKQEYRAPSDFSVPLPQQDIELSQFQKVLIEPPVVNNYDSIIIDNLRKFDNWSEQFLTHLAISSSMDDRIGLLSMQFPDIAQDDIETAYSLDNPALFIDVAKSTLNYLYGKGVVGDLPVGNYREVTILSESLEQDVPVSGLISASAIGDTLVAKLQEKYSDNNILIWAAQFLEPFVAPNLVYNATETKKRQQLARESVKTSRDFIKGERIIGAGDRVTEKESLFLIAMQNEMKKSGMLSDGASSSIVFKSIARILLLTTVLSLFGWVAWSNFMEMLTVFRQLAAATILICLFIFLADFTFSQPSLGVFALPIPFASVLFTALYRDKIGYAASILLVCLLVPVVGSEPQSLLYWLVMAVFSVSMVRRVRNRDQYYKTIAALIILNLLLITLSMLAVNSFAGVWHQYMIGIVTPVASIALALFLLPVVEPAVGVSSDLTLLELSDLNHPLLKKMALEAQGTFHHSQVVAQLGEQAARSIGANSLLVRVGALFHDIGKLTKPEYYVENQGGGHNKHDELSPSMSALIVSSHVKEGIEMARKWRLPKAVIDFIPEHHGTGIMTYFYHKAMKEDSGDTVNVSSFRYDGPKPQTRETAILMLADAVEAATRSLAKPTPGRIKEVTKKVAQERILSGELDECQLTISDLSKIREAFIPLLSGIHHSRISYPGQTAEKESSHS